MNERGNKVFGTFKCGCAGNVIVWGDEAQRTKIAKDKFSTRVCPQCYKRRFEANVAEGEAEAREYAQQNNLPPLSGTEKQVKWAMTIRHKLIQRILAIYDEGTTEQAKADTGMYAVRQKLINRASSKWWIDNREVTDDEIKRLILDEYQKLKLESSLFVPTATASNTVSVGGGDWGGEPAPEYTDRDGEMAMAFAGETAENANMDDLPF